MSLKEYHRILKGSQDSLEKAQAMMRIAAKQMAQITKKKRHAYKHCMMHIKLILSV